MKKVKKIRKNKIKQDREKMSRPTLVRGRQRQQQLRLSLSWHEEKEKEKRKRKRKRKKRKKMTGKSEGHLGGVA